jgi:transketolase
MRGRDKFILSKGHGTTSLYAVLAGLGKISTSELNTYCKDGTLLACHPPCRLNKIAGITFGTGSLGHGLSLATGVALADKLNRKKRDIYCLISDGECDEGSIWEAALFAGHHNLKNLFVVIDDNGLQAFGKTREVVNIEPLEEKWRSFNFDVLTVDGHDFDSIDNAFKKLSASKKPKCIIAKTNAGISFMKDEVEWHYLPMDDEHYKKAKKEINKI